LASLDVAMNTNLDGELFVDGPVRVRVGATLSSPSGNLTLHAQSIAIDQGASIVISPTGTTADGRGGNGTTCTYYDYFCRCLLAGYSAGGGGGYGTAGNAGAGNCASSGGPTMLSDTDSEAVPGAQGGNGANGGGLGGNGGGVLRLIAGQIAMAGQITANG